MNVTLRRGILSGNASPSYSAWKNKEGKVRDDTIEAIELIEFSDKIGRMLSQLGVNAGTGFHEMMKILYRRSIIEIGKIDKNKTSYVSFVSKVNNIIKELFDEIFLDFLNGNGFDIVSNQNIIGYIHIQIRTFIKEHL